MMRRLFFFLVLAGTTLLFLCATGNSQPPPETLFKVRRIKSQKKVWLIYAQRNDSLFEIVSPRVFPDSCRNVRVGGLYKFTLWSSGVRVGPYGHETTYYLGHITHSIMHNAWVSLTKAPRHQLYTAAGLRGLCLRTGVE